VPQALLGEELASAKQKALDAWADLKKYPYLTYAELREWLVGGGVQTQRFIALGNALGPVESMRLLQQFSPQDLAMLRGDTSENASELPGYAALLQLHRKVMAEVIRKPQSISTLNFPELVKASDTSLASALKETTDLGIALCINILPPSRAQKIIEALPPEKKSACVDGIAKFDSLSDAEITQELATLKNTLAPVLATGTNPRLNGAETLAQILSESSAKTRASLQESLERHTELRVKITENMVTFDDVVGVEDETLSEMIDELEPEQIATLMVGIRREWQSRIVKILSRKVVISVQSEFQRLSARNATLRRAQTQSIEIQNYLVEKLKALVNEGVVEIRRKSSTQQIGEQAAGIPQAAQEESADSPAETATPAGASAESGGGNKNAV
jgi:flagellar motor switch protein FliG